MARSFGIVGPDGAGKTTTIQMLAGILIPAPGEIHVAGVDVVRRANQLGGKIGYMSLSLIDDLVSDRDTL